MRPSTRHVGEAAASRPSRERADLRSAARAGKRTRASRPAPPKCSACLRSPPSAITAPSARAPAMRCPRAPLAYQLSVPIFDGGRRDAERAESASQYRAEKTRTNDLKQQIELDVRLALDELQSAEDQVKVRKEGLDAFRKRTGAGAPPLRGRRRHQRGSHRRADPPGARARQPDSPRSTAYNVARRPGAGHGKVRASLQTGLRPVQRRRRQSTLDGTHMKKRIIPILILLAAAGAALYAFRGAHRRPITASSSPATSSSPKSTSPSKPPAA